MWNICGFEVTAGTKKQVILGVDMGELSHDGRITVIPDDVENLGIENEYMMPATLIAGARPGKTVLFTAGIHAGEYPGTPAVMDAASEIDPEKVCGNIIFIHCVNTSGFNQRTNGLVPEDDFNLNGGYPGKADGTVGERIAAYFCTEVFPHIDFLCDFHSGGNGESMYPCLFYPVKCEVEEASLEAALALDIPYPIKSMSRTGEMHWAAREYKVPGLLIETGHSSLAYDEWIDLDKRNIFLLLNHLGVYKKADLYPDMVCMKYVSSKNYYPEASADGVWQPMVREHEEVRKGQILGIVTDFFGNTIETVYAEGNGVIFYRNAGIYAKPGYPLMAYGLKEGFEVC